MRHSHLIVGDSFVKNLHDYHSIRGQGVRFGSRNRVEFLYTRNYSSIQTIRNLGKMDFADVCQYSSFTHFIFHIGGNDLSATDVNPTDLACFMFNVVIDHLDSTDTPVATILPITHRFGEHAFSNNNCKDRFIVNRDTLPEIERKFNARVDEFNTAIRELVHFSQESRIFYGHLFRLTHNPAQHYKDGIHFSEPRAMNLYARAMQSHINLGNHRSDDRMTMPQSVSTIPTT